MDNQTVVNEVISYMLRGGFLPGSESYDICKRALQFLDFSYKRSEELEDGGTVDCSTLVSQSYWEGAAIGIPFVAENQRTAMSGRSISTVEEMIPADVLVKYASLEETSDKTWNHVGLYLGRDSSDEQWLIESTSKTGVRLSRVAEFNQKGGIKRFTLARNVFHSPQAHTALALTPFVPKFGRLGVRQYRVSNTGRVPHKGIDIYADEGTSVYATLSGKVSLVENNLENSLGVAITGDTLITRYFMLGEIYVKEGDVITMGTLIGKVASPSVESDIVYSTAKTTHCHLHLEVEKNGVYLNHLYLSKIGVLDIPFGF